MSRSLDAMYYDYDATIIIIIFITIHTIAKVKYMDIRNFIDSAFLYFIPFATYRNIDVLGRETTNSSSILGGCNCKFFVERFIDKPFYR